MLCFALLCLVACFECFAALLSQITWLRFDDLLCSVVACSRDLLARLWRLARLNTRNSIWCSRLELARLMLFLGLLACLLWFGLVGLVTWFAFVCFAVICLLACFALLCLLGLLYLFDLLSYATLCDAWLCRFHLVWLGLTLLGLVWLSRLASWHALNFEQKNQWNLSKREPTPARIEVEHDFLKTHVPVVILKFVCQPSDFIRFLNP